MGTVIEIIVQNTPLLRVWSMCCSLSTIASHHEWDQYGKSITRRGDTLKNAFFTPSTRSRCSGSGAIHHPVNAPRDSCDRLHRDCSSNPGCDPSVCRPGYIRCCACAAIALVYLMAVLEFGLKGFERGFFASYLPPGLGIILLIFSLVALLLYLKPLSAINVAYNKVRIPGIVTFFMGIGNFLLAVMIPYLAGWNYYGVALAGAIVLTLKNAFFTPWYATKILGISKTTFLNSMIPGVFAMIMTAGASNMMAHYLNIQEVVSLVFCGLIITAAYMYVLWGFCLKQTEKKIVESFMPLKIRSILHNKAKCDR